MPVLSGQVMIVDDGLTPVERVLRRLPNARHSGSQWTASCPVTANHKHGDRRPSLSVAEGTDGRALINCHAGCLFADIMHALDLPLSAAFPLPSSNGRQTQAASQPSQNGHSREVAHYNYFDEEGTALFQTVRYEPKNFKQRRQEHNGWVWSIEGVRRVLYRLPELLRAPVEKYVYVCEGEKDVETLRALGLVATCNPLGSCKEPKGSERSKWLPEYTEWLRDRFCVVLEDNDDAGREHARVVAEALHGTAATVKVLRLPDLPDRGDVSDWVGTGGTAALLDVLATNAPEWGAEGDQRPPRFTIHTFSELRIALPPPEVVVDGLTYKGSLSAHCGDGGTGKTYYCLAKAIAIAAGIPFLGRETKAGRVLVIDEESGHYRLHHRLNALLRGFDYQGPDLPIDWITSSGFNLRTAGDVIEMERIIEAGHYDYLLVDALMEVTAGADENSVADLMPALHKLHGWCQRYELATDLIHHNNRSGKYRGSSAIKGVVDQMLLFQKEEGRDTIVVKTEKNRDGEPFGLLAKLEFSQFPVYKVTLTGEIGSRFKGQKLLPAERWLHTYLTTHGQATLADAQAEARNLPGRTYAAGTIANAAVKLVEYGLVRRVGGDSDDQSNVLEVVEKASL